MNIFDIIILAIALSIDAMIVSFSNGLIFNSQRIKKSLALAFTVGFFQFFMPIVGYFFTQPINEFVKPYSHWIVFLIFGMLGFKFIKDSFEVNKQSDQLFKKRYLLSVGVATSIDALFAGVYISLFSNIILYPALIIGIVTFINSTLGFWSSKFLKNLNSKFLERCGGSILIILGLKVLFTAIL